MKYISITVFLFSLSLFFACNNALLEAPKAIESSTNSSINVPSGLVASQGKKRRITLSWDSVPNAKRYCVYYAPNQFEEFKKILVTADVTQTELCNTVEITVQSGTTAWYCVSAVDINEEETEKSAIVMGTSLYCPFISSIEAVSDTEAQVFWYMGNVQDNTYKKDLRYVVTCINADSSVNQVITTEGKEDSVKFSNLKPNTKYFYFVEAYLVTEQSDTETSLIVDGETARRLRPNEVENLKASKGSYTDKVSLTWELPEKVQVKSENGYEYKDLYFKIYRRVLNSTKETEWMELDSYFGAHPKAGDEGPAFISTQTVQKQQDGSYINAGEIITFYQEGIIVKWEDNLTGLSDYEKEQEFEYKVQSFADEVSVNITSNLSIKTVKGYKMVPIHFATKEYTPTIEEENKISSASTQFNLIWNNRDAVNDYVYVIMQTYYKFPKDNSDNEDTQGESILLTPSANSSINYFSSIDSVNNTKKYFDLTELVEGQEIPINRGYYEYTVYVIPKDYKDNILNAESLENSNYVLKEKSETGRITVSNILITINNLKILQGYSDRFVIEWEYADDTTYTIEYTDVKTGEDKISKVITPSKESGDQDYKIDKEKRIVTIVDKAESGDIRKYKIGSNTGGVPSGGVGEKEYRTLATPKPEFEKSKLSYTDITVKWQKIPLAEKYIIKIDGTQKAEVDVDDDIDEYVYTIENAELLDNGTIYAPTSGKTHQVTITAVSVEDDENNVVGGQTTNGFVDAWTVGMQQLKLDSEPGKEPYYIDLNYNVLSDLRHYQMIRTRGDLDLKTNDWVLQNNETFYINIENNSVKVLSQTKDTLDIPAVVASLIENKINIKDIDCAYLSKVVNGAQDVQSEYEPTDAFMRSQSRIAWGLPYRYLVFPLLNENDLLTINEDGTAILETSTNQTIKYSNIFTNNGDNKTSVTSSTVGFGLNVTATKAEDPFQIVVSWHEPYYVNQNYPYIKSKRNNEQWDNGESLSKGVISKTINTLDKTDTGSYEYRIQYRRSINDARDFSNSYILMTQNVLDENNEQKNKGYLFSLGDFKAVNIPENGAEGFTERINWSNWDYSNRKRGPDSDVVIYEQNLNNSGQWFPVATIDKYGNWGRYGSNADDARGWYNCKFVSSNENNWLEITPYEGKSSSTLMGDNSDCHDGLLKVQRDMMHNYKIVAKRQNSNGTEITYENTAETYRRISGPEFTKNVMLVVADSLHIAGDPGSNGSKTINGSTGSFKISNSYHAIPIYYSLKTNYENYTHIFAQLPGLDSEQSSYLKISGSGGGRCYNATNGWIGDTNLTVSYSGELKTPVTSYYGTVKFNAGNSGYKSVDTSIHWTLNIESTPKYGNAIKVEVKDNKEQFVTWFPYSEAAKLENGYNGKKSDDAEPNKDKYECFNGVWWEVKK